MKKDIKASNRLLNDMVSKVYNLALDIQPELEFEVEYMTIGTEKSGLRDNHKTMRKIMKGASDLAFIVCSSGNNDNDAMIIVLAYHEKHFKMREPAITVFSIYADDLNFVHEDQYNPELVITESDFYHGGRQTKRLSRFISNDFCQACRAYDGIVDDHEIDDDVVDEDVIEAEGYAKW